MALQWFKVYGSEYLSDPKIRSMTPQERSCWITLLCLASNSTKIGTIEYLTIESLLEMSGIKWDPYDTTEYDNAKAVLSKLERMKMITSTVDGIITILNWDKRQEHNLTIAERVAKHRLKQKNVTSNVTNVTSNKIRLNKNKEESSETSSPESLKVERSREYLKKIPAEDLQGMYERFDCSKEAIVSKAEDLLNWCEVNGKNKKNYRAFLLVALKKDFPARKAPPPKGRSTIIKDGKAFLIED